MVTVLSLSVGRQVIMWAQCSGHFSFEGHAVKIRVKIDELEFLILVARILREIVNRKLAPFVADHVEIGMFMRPFRARFCRDP